MRPPAGRTKPATARRAVVLPEPDGPIMARISPAATSRVSGFNTTAPRYATLTPSKATFERAAVSAPGAARADAAGTAMLMSAPGDLAPALDVGRQVLEHLRPIRSPDCHTLQGLVQSREVLVRGRDVLARRHADRDGRDGLLSFLAEQEFDQLLAVFGVGRARHQADVVGQGQRRALPIRTSRPEDADVRIVRHLRHVHLHITVGDVEFP